jgi:hypothetical protein
VKGTGRRRRRSEPRRPSQQRRGSREDRVRPNATTASSRSRRPPGTSPARSRPRCSGPPVLGEVAGETHAGLGHGPAPSGCLAGCSVVPLDPGDGGCRGMPQGRQGQAAEPTKSAMDQGCRPWSVQKRGWSGRLRRGVGHASPVRPAPSTLGRLSVTQTGQRSACSDRPIHCEFETHERRAVLVIAAGGRP